MLLQSPSGDEGARPRKRQRVSDQEEQANVIDDDQSAHVGGGFPRTLELTYWGRTDECLQRKWAHMDLMDELFPSRESCILSTTLADEQTVLEPNMFPYDTLEGIEHWTLWSRHEMGVAEIETFVCGWLRENRPQVESWNYDDNESRSIDVFHVHVYLKGAAHKDCGSASQEQASG